MNKAAVTGHMETAGLLPLRGRKARLMWLDSGREPQFRLSGWSPWPKPRHPVPAGSEPGSPAAAPSAFLSLIPGGGLPGPGRWSPSGRSGSGCSLPTASHACMSWGPCPAPRRARGEGWPLGEAARCPVALSRSRLLSGMQLVLLQAVLPPLCPGEHRRLPSGNPARLAEKEGSSKEARRPAQFSGLSAAGCQVPRGACTGCGSPGLCGRVWMG